MEEALTFGWRTATLSIAFVQLLLIAAALTRTLANRVANRTLAALLLVLAGIFTPWMIGFAGFYDRWPWLTFLPVANTLAVAPLTYLYIHALVHGGWPDHGWRHLVPGIAQFAFLTGSFLLPLAAKDRWSDLIAPVYGPLVDLGVFAGFLLYGRASLMLIGRYRRRLAAQRSDDNRYALAWLSRAIAAALLLLLVWTGYTLWDAIAPLGYRGLMGLYLAIAAFALFLGIEGWRHSGQAFPTIAALEAAEQGPGPDAGDAAAEPRDWAEEGRRWLAMLRTEQWYRDPALDVPGLARRLGTNRSYVSRAFNAGLGASFSTIVNALRSEAVADAIDRGAPDDLLDLALDAGFNSKASFNRAFLSRFGTTPSAYRAAMRQRGAAPALPAGPR